MNRFLDRLLRAESWSLYALHRSDYPVAVAARGPVAELLCLFSACLGTTRQTVLTPDFADGLRAADRAMRHHRAVNVDLQERILTGA